MSQDDSSYPVESVAIIGMAGRFPGAKNLDEFWENLRDGVESIARFTEDELLASGVEPELVKSANYVPARGVVQNIDYFDAAFFGLSPREAEIMDPQFRFFLENAWESLENAGYDSQTYPGMIGIFGGMSLGQYLLRYLLPNREIVASAGPLQLRILNDKDFLTTLAAYKLNLRGPAVNVQTACSTSLVAVHLACQSLVSYQCDLALAGGVSIVMPPKSGYWPQEGVFSPDGHCRAFDAGAAGTVSGNGVGTVVLKRLPDALSDGDHIRAIIRGSAINNDGSLKVSYTAPSVDGQAEVIAMAQAVAQVEPETITYIEAHGTGTPMGDPIEVAALSQVFRASTEEKEFCALGSVKTNIGHLDAAAGVASLVKTVLALENKTLPPSLHFKQPNPQIDFRNSPFYVNSTLNEWTTSALPRRAGISAFAVGGSNAHVVVEEAPVALPSGPSKPWQLIPLSAKTPTALETATDNLAAYLKMNANVNLADVAYTLKVGRATFGQRRVAVCRDVDDLVMALESRDPKRVFTYDRNSDRPSIAFMFPGLGNHYVNMGWELYQLEPGFRTDIDRCCELLKEHLGSDLRDVIYPEWKQGPGAMSTMPAPAARFNLRQMLQGLKQDDEVTRRLNETVFSQPALFVIEYALAQLWMRMGIQPQALIGYSVGEYVAACLAGVWSLDDALMIVAKRAQLIQELPAGSMLAISLPSSEVKPLLGKALSLSAVNGPAVCVVSGPTEAIGELETALARRGVIVRRLQTSHAFHSHMMEPVVESFMELIRSIELHAPNIPLISDLTGTWLTANEAMSPQYWAMHLSHPVLFGDGIEELWRGSTRVLLEVGPGQALGAWAMQHPLNQQSEGGLVLASLRHSYDQQSDQAFLLTTLGRLWLAGCSVDWVSFYEGERRLRLPLPSYPFERQRYWVEAPAKDVEPVGSPVVNLAKASAVADWFYVPVWKQALPLAVVRSIDPAPQNYLVFEDECGVGASLIAALKQTGHTIVSVCIGEDFAKLDDETFLVNPQHEGDYNALLNQLEALRKLPDVICHLWTVTSADLAEDYLESCDKHLDSGFFSLVFLAQALAKVGVTWPTRLMVVSNGLQSVSGEELLHPVKAAILGPCIVIPQEYPHFKSQAVDIGHKHSQNTLTEQLLSEITTDSPEPLVAYRGSHRWLRSFEKLRLKSNGSLLRENGVYLITGGVGGIGLTLAQYIAERVRARLVLVGRSEFPAASEWANWLNTHDEYDEVRQQIEKIQTLQATGAQVFVARADVTARDEMQKVISETHERFGKIDGVIHAAGVSPGGMIQLKTAAAATSVLDPKVKGALVLEELLKDEKLNFLILCSSLTAITGAFGLVDHCAANAFLDTFAESRALQGNHYTLSLNWDVWLEVGQAARASLSKRMQQILHTAPRAERTSNHWDQLLVDEPRQEIHSIELSTAKQWFLDEHRFQDAGVLPGTGYLELVRAAVARHAGGRAIVMRKVVFLAPLVVKDNEVREARLILEKRDHDYDFRIICKAGNGESGWQEHVRGKVSWHEQEQTTRHPLGEMLERLKPQPMKEAESQSDAAPLSKDFGPRWQSLIKALNVVDGEGIACLELPPEFVADLKLFKLHPSLLDAATGFGQVAGHGAYLPQAYESIRINGPLPAKLYSYVKFKENKDALVYDLILMDHEGRELVEIKGYTLRQINDLQAFSAASKVTFAPGDSGESNVLLAATNEIGIRPAEGAEAFGLVLQSGLRVPRIAISTRHLPTLIEHGAGTVVAPILVEVDKLQSRRKKHSRPNLQVPYIFPRSDMESKLTQMWQETLSIDAVGIHDNFFDMGGDSLIATLLVDRLSEAFEVNVSLAALINAPTVAEMSVIVTELRNEGAAAAAE